AARPRLGHGESPPVPGLPHVRQAARAPRMLPHLRLAVGPNLRLLQVIGAVERPLDGPVMEHTHLAPAAVVEGRRHAIGHIAAEEPPSRLQWHRLSQSALGHVVITPCTPTVRSRPTPQGGRRSIRTDGLSIFSPAPCDKALLTTPGDTALMFSREALMPHHSA